MLCNKSFNFHKIEQFLSKIPKFSKFSATAPPKSGHETQFFPIIFKNSDFSALSVPKKWSLNGQNHPSLLGGHSPNAISEKDQYLNLKDKRRKLRSQLLCYSYPDLYWSIILKISEFDAWFILKWECWDFIDFSCLNSSSIACWTVLCGFSNNPLVQIF